MLGGSFNPAHEGHLSISLEALKRLDLDRVWWMVAPQNPLKAPIGMAPFEARMESAEWMARHPRILVTDFEWRAGTRYSFDTVEALKRAYPRHRFVFLMGADNFAGLHRWDRWDALMRAIPVAVMARPSYDLKAMTGPAAQRFRSRRLTGRKARRIADFPAPAWTFVSFRHHPASSTAIRAAGARPLEGHDP